MTYFAHGAKVYGMVQQQQATAYERFCEIVKDKGLKKRWVAERLGILPGTLTNRLKGRYGYPWQPGDHERLASLLEVHVADIWPGFWSDAR